MIAQQERRGLLVVLSGPSGVGKDVAIARLKQQGFAIHYVVVNLADRLDQAVDHIRCIITAERLRVQPRQTELL